MAGSELLAFALLGLVIGPAFAVWPRALAGWWETSLGIGWTSSGESDPAAWLILFNRAVGVGWFLAGVVAAALVLV